LTDTYRDLDALNRRRHARYPVEEEVMLAILNPFVPGGMPARTVDIARNGIGLVVSEFVSRFSLVEIRSANTVLFGEVRHCSAVEDGFRLGVAISDAYFIRPKIEPWEPDPGPAGTA
jgi:hypothetical protein